MPKKLKIYELYASEGRIKRDYTHQGLVLHVSAKSIRQAYFVAAKAYWVDERDDLCGLVEVRTDPDCAYPWLDWQGDRNPLPQFEHGQCCQRRLSKALMAIPQNPMTELISAKV